MADFLDGIFFFLAGCNGKDGRHEKIEDYWPGSEWKEVLPEEVGLDGGKLVEAELYLQRYPTQAFLVTRHGYIAYEKYYVDFSKEDEHDSYSVAKCFTSAAVGSAIQEDLISSEKARLTEFISAEEANTPNPEHYDQIKIEHLLTMTSGIEFNNRKDYPEMIKKDNWADYVLQKRIVNKPGEYWKYKADPTLLSAVITDVTGKSMYDHAKENIFDVIGMGEIRWESDPCGITSGNGNLFATARDYARLGYLMLNDGVWDGKRILAESWVDKSTGPCMYEERVHCDCWSEEPMKVPEGKVLEYGYGWWSRKFEGVPNDASYAFGGKGQFILVIPSLDIVAVRLADDRVKSDEVILPEMAKLISQAAEK